MNNTSGSSSMEWWDRDGYPVNCLGVVTLLNHPFTVPIRTHNSTPYKYAKWQKTYARMINVSENVIPPIKSQPTQRDNLGPALCTGDIRVVSSEKLRSYDPWKLPLCSTNSYANSYPICTQFVRIAYFHVVRVRIYILIKSELESK